MVTTAPTTIRCRYLRSICRVRNRRVCIFFVFNNVSIRSSRNSTIGVIGCIVCRLLSWYHGTGRRCNHGHRDRHIRLEIHVDF
jgi:hypothetical protein